VTSRLAAVTLPEESFVAVRRTVAVPEPLASAPLIGGTSLDGSNVAVSVAVAVADGVSLLVQPAAMNPRTISPKRYGDFMSVTPLRDWKNFRPTLNPRYRALAAPGGSIGDW